MMIVKRKKGVVNARSGIKESFDGHIFDSKLECYFYKQCKNLKIDVQVKPETFTIVEGFKFHGESIRPIKYTPDFKLPKYNVIIETKGFPNEAFPMRLKLWKKYMVSSERSETYKQLKNKKEVDDYLISLLTY